MDFFVDFQMLLVKTFGGWYCVAIVDLLVIVLCLQVAISMFIVVYINNDQVEGMSSAGRGVTTCATNVCVQKRRVNFYVVAMDSVVSCQTAWYRG